MTESSVPGVISPLHYPGHGQNAGTGVAICHAFTDSLLSISVHVATLDVDAATILEESTTFFLQHAANRVASESS
ncbi:hypothetical protein OOZ51_09190 [Arthrobacter sp. MI7-26]|nr:hypothetical protein [Arthrobacter sp. MI7-26]